ncbi:ribosome biogenesis GTP-binding protein YihA/YsxC [Methylococcus mesophilus]|uniref:ribosome biogenesis GTP-binding protein YihA/YsxC n=1 Tax=Methylococcus mesophilus TaxID=2993564 RepID=UPI00224B4F68|nr:ribosome biogenesis GTP-binding protein YihA/YsxC [Methylococcus mesophilus]UZR28165.1 ribosome biogenesis GTP-binding protein YihA/YsxC [Methylococcus mesophilus]
MKIPPVSIRYLRSILELKDAPPDQGYEVAFAGRSNAGKSSAINTLANIGRLARVSKTPGRTQMINFFTIDDERRLVDLPGYGYAKVPGEIHRRWEAALERYLRYRESLRGVFLLMDIRHPFTEMDEIMIEWCAHRSIALHVALTKSDKLSRGAARNTWLLAKTRLASYGAPDFSVQLFSSLKKTGTEEAWEVLGKWLALPPEDKEKASGA